MEYKLLNDGGVESLMKILCGSADVIVAGGGVAGRAVSRSCKTRLFGYSV